MNVLERASYPPTGRTGSRLAKVGLLVLVLLYAFFGQGVRGIWKPDEGRYTCVALNMLDSGDWLHPRLNDDKPHFTKPPLTYWTIAASILVFGRNEWAARFPNSMALAGTILLIAALGPRLSSRSPRLAALIYASSPLVYIAANLVTTDTLLAFWEMLAMVGFLEWWHRGEAKKHCRWLMLMWAAFGLAFMTKGPPGLLPLLPLLIFTGVRGGRQAVGALFSWTGLALFAAIGLTWYVVVIGSDPSLLGYFLGKEIYGRIVTGEHRRNAEWYGAFIIYLPILLLGALPWNLVLLRKLRGKGKEHLSSISQVSRTACPEHLLLMLWFCVPLVIFCLARSRLPLYLLPLFGPLSFLLARLFEGIDMWQGRRRWLITGWLVLMASTRVIGGMVATDKNTHAFATAIQRQVNNSPEEIVFVDASPDFGLRFYLNAEVERVNFKPNRGEETLTQEIARMETGQLFIVHRRDEDDLLRIKPPNGYSWAHVGGYKNSRLYAFEKPLAAKRRLAYVNPSQPIFPITSDENLKVLTELSGMWIDHVYPRMIHSEQPAMAEQRKGNLGLFYDGILGLRTKSRTQKSNE